MAGASQMNWTITIGWERLEKGSPEERACFAAIGIRAHNIWLTEGQDTIANRLCNEPLLSAYHLAEWFAWNWWRLRWEPRSRAQDWEFVHRLSSIGGGYIWPNMTIFSDGERTALIARPTSEHPHTAFRYIADAAVIIPATEFESELDRFIELVIDRLDLEGIEGTNLHTVWKSLSQERTTPEEAEKKKLEALLGRDPDTADPRTIEQLIGDISVLGNSAIEELAAEHGQSGRILTALDIRRIASQSGFDSSERDVVKMNNPVPLSDWGLVAAWRIGRDMARSLRDQLRLTLEPISDTKLAEMGGSQEELFENRNEGSKISFALKESPYRSRIVLRSKWKMGRRFEFARLLGDRLASQGASKLFLATRSNTYRQKIQRSFAAEFLSPFEAVDGMLAGDYSMENQSDVAEHFGVSPLTIRTLLVHHDRLEREDLNEE